MDTQQLAEVEAPAPEPRLSVNDLTDQSERTLVYGYNLNRKTFHVYLKDGVIHRVVYSGGSSATPARVDSRKSDVEWDPADLAPTKRAYPERCDFEFATLLKSKGVVLPFTTFNDEFDGDGPFFGYVG